MSSDGLRPLGRAARSAVEETVADQKSCPAEPGEGDRFGVRGDYHAEARDPGGDQHHIGDRAQRHDGQHVLTADALPQHERVLGADCNHESQAGCKADEQR